MAWYAKIANGAVVEVIFIVDQYDSNWLYREFGGTWLRCAEDGSIRRIFPTIGYTYDAQRDAFIPPKPYASWLLNEDTCLWEPPVPMPDDGGYYIWNDDTESWDQISQE